VGEGDVLEDFETEGAMAADGEVRLGFDEDELAVGGGDSACRVIHLGGRIGEGEFGEDERHEHALEGSGGELSR